MKGEVNPLEIGSKTPDGLGRLEEVNGLPGRPACCFDAIGNTHTAEISPRQEEPGVPFQGLADLIHSLGNAIVKMPVTHAKVFGWYDNEYGGYTNLLGDLTVHVHQILD